MKERLIELITKSDILCDTCGENSPSYCAEALADYLLANGVIVPPCKVGDTVYYFVGCEICTATVRAFSINTLDNWSVVHCRTKCDLTGSIRFGFWMFGKTVFLTREEAEKALAERNNNEKV